MSEIIHLKSITELNRIIQVETFHPLVAVVDFTKTDEAIADGTRLSADFYTVMFKNYCVNKLRYGRQPIDFQEGSLICVAPRQVVTMDQEAEERSDRMGWGLFFHPDLLRGAALSAEMSGYSFFHYETHEALNLSDKEKQTLFECVQKIEQELKENIDRHSQALIVSTIALLLNYCTRYYERQFITRKASNSSVLVQVEKVLKSYFQSDRVHELGLPTVSYLAEQVHLSPSYLSDLLKRETGLSAQDHIHAQLIEEAKLVLLNSDRSVSEIAYGLGFQYPQYFSKLFKQKTGSSPAEFRGGR